MDSDKALNLFLVKFLIENELNGKQFYLSLQWKVEIFRLFSEKHEVSVPPASDAGGWHSDVIRYFHFIKEYWYSKFFFNVAGELRNSDIFTEHM